MSLTKALNQITSREWKTARRVLLADAAWAGWLALALGLGVGYLTRLAGSFGDEGDTLTSAWLITQGWAPYRDLFSHHFPFAYYWVAGFFELFWPGIGVARLSVLVFQALAFAVPMLVTRRFLAFGLGAFLWNSLAYLFYGNLALYQAFNALTLAPLFMLALFASLHPGRIDSKTLIAFGVFALAAGLNNPLAIFAFGVALACLVMAIRPFRRLALPFLVLAGGFGIFLLVLALANSLTAFIDSAFRFNLEVYSRYSSAMTTNYLLQFLDNAASGLNILQVANPIPAPESGQIPAWLFSPAVYKLAIFGLSLALLLSRRYLAAAFVYLFAAAALTHQRTHFDHMPVIMLASLALGSLAALPSLLGPDLSPDFMQGGRGPARLFHPLVRAGAVLLILALSISSLAYTFSHRQILRYQYSFSAYENEAQRLLRLGCGEAERLGYYPGNPYIQFLTRLPPVSRYVFLWPWVAEVGQGQVIAALHESPRAIVYLDERIEVWGRRAGVYLAPLLDTLERSYIMVDERTYLSPALARACGR